MSALPPLDLLHAPQLASLGFSLAGLALAESAEEIEAAADEFDLLLSDLSPILAELRSLSDGLDEADLGDAPGKVRAVLDSALAVEHRFSDLRNGLDRVLHRPPSYSLSEALGPESAARLRAAERQISQEFIPTVREVRLRIICAVAQRAKSADINVFDPSEAFCVMFRNATLPETESWQETAYILVNTEAAKRLSESIRSVSIDKTEQIASAFPDTRSA